MLLTCLCFYIKYSLNFKTHLKRYSRKTLEKETRLKTQNYYDKKLTKLFPETNFKIRRNLTFELRTALKDLSQSTENKGNGFVILSNKDALQKIEEQIGESVVSNTDPTSALRSRIQKHLTALCKQQKV